MSSIRNKLHLYLKLRGVEAKRYQKRSKLREEVRELEKAILHHRKHRTLRSKGHLMDEVADVMWCLSAISEKNEFSVEDAMELKTSRDAGRNIKRS